MNKTYQVLMSRNKEAVLIRPKPEASVSFRRQIFLCILLWLNSPLRCKFGFHSKTNWEEFSCEYTFGRAGRGMSEIIYFTCRHCRKLIGEMKSKDIPREEYIAMIEHIGNFIKSDEGII